MLTDTSPTCEGALRGTHDQWHTAGNKTFSARLFSSFPNFERPDAYVRFSRYSLQVRTIVAVILNLPFYPPTNAPPFVTLASLSPRLHPVQKPCSNSAFYPLHCMHKEDRHSHNSVNRYTTEYICVCNYHNQLVSLIIVISKDRKSVIKSYNQ